MQTTANGLFSLLHERLSSAPNPCDQDAPPPFKNADVYVLASLLQKAIRRGDLPTARRAGHQLLTLDPSRLWRRLRVTALEDVGIGDIEASAELVAITAHPELRRVLGGNMRALDYALARVCGAAKDRTPDHFGSIVEREPANAGLASALGHASDNALTAVLADRSADWVRRAHAATILFRRFEQFTSARRQQKLAPVFEQFRGLGTPELLVAACQAYASRERNILPLYVLLAWSLRDTDNSPTTETIHALSAPDLIDGIPAYGFDPHHTRVGRRAVELWRRT